jgi:hypothetical protein
MLAAAFVRSQDSEATGSHTFFSPLNQTHYMKQIFCYLSQKCFYLFFIFIYLSTYIAHYPCVSSKRLNVTELSGMSDHTLSQSKWVICSRVWDPLSQYKKMIKNQKQQQTNKHTHTQTNKLG